MHVETEDGIRKKKFEPDHSSFSCQVKAQAPVDIPYF